MQVLLPPAEKVSAEPGALFYMSSKIQCSTRGQLGFGLISAIQRLISGESYFLNTFTNTSSSPEYVAFATPTLARICPLDLHVLGEMVAQTQSYFCSIGDVKVSSKMASSLSAGLLGGEGLFFQTLSGKGLCFVCAGGTPVQKTLAENETVFVDKGCLVAYQASVKYELQYTGSIKNALFGGEGIYMQKLTGPGLVILESLPTRRLMESLNPLEKRRSAERSCLGIVFSLLFVLFFVATFVFIALSPALKDVVIEQWRHFEL